jgi:hypothetical protein
MYAHPGILMVLLFELKAHTWQTGFFYKSHIAALFSSNFRQRFIILFTLVWTLILLHVPLCQLLFQACTSTPGILVELDGFQSALFPISASWIAEIISVTPHTSS